MPLYVAEFQFRYNNRENADIFATAIAGCQATGGKQHGSQHSRASLSDSGTSLRYGAYHSIIPML
jgi:hypothetical protein